MDESGINESRACFESYDPDIIIKDESKAFGAFTSELAQQQVPTNERGEYTDYMKLNLAADMSLLGAWRTKRLFVFCSVRYRSVI